LLTLRSSIAGGAEPPLPNSAESLITSGKAVPGRGVHVRHR